MKSIMYFAVSVFAMAIGTGVVNASGPIAVYALVDKVTFEPNADKPARIRVDGVFIASELRSNTDTGYSAPQRGYLYFSLPKGYEDLARREWADLKSVAGTRQVVGLGSSWGWRGRVRKADEEAKAPDDHPVGNGLVRINADQPRARALLDYKDR